MDDKKNIEKFVNIDKEEDVIFWNRVKESISLMPKEKFHLLFKYLQYDDSQKTKLQTVLEKDEESGKKMQELYVDEYKKRKQFADEAWKNVYKELQKIASKINEKEMTEQGIKDIMSSL